MPEIQWPKAFIIVAWGIASGMLFGHGTSQAAPTHSDSQPLEDLGDRLLDDAALRDLLDNAKPTRPGDKTPTAPRLLPEVDELRRMLEPESRKGREGEDIGQAGESPLERISSDMAHASQLIESQATTGETRAVQEEIVTQLDSLIEQLSKQCQKCSGGSCNKPGQQQTQSNTPKPGKGGKPQPNAASQAAPQSRATAAGGGGEAQPGEVADRDVVKQLWGQLPERLRQQLLQSTTDEFLPKYRAELQQYFRRLSEEQ